MPSNPNRMLLLDAMKGLAAQLIVLHHLASYGPLAEAFSDMLPTLAAFLFDYGRMVVQVFLVVGGYLAARSLAVIDFGSVANPLPLLWRRYVRLALPFAVAMLIAILAAAVARHWLDDDFIPDAPSLGQMLAHGMLLHGVFDVPSLSAGVWYVAIDLQLFALLALVLWCGRWLGGERSGASLGWILAACLGVLALFVFNRNEVFDAWGIYFFGSYALGAFAWWLTTRPRPLFWLAALLAVALAALTVDFRLRIALALAIAVLLAVASLTGMLGRWPRSNVLAWLGKVSYSVFLVHFPVCIVVNAGYDYFFEEDELAAIAAILAAWGISLLAGALFHRHVETRRQWLPAAVSAAARSGFSALLSLLAKIPRILARA